MFLNVSEEVHKFCEVAYMHKLVKSATCECVPLEDTQAFL